VVVGDAGALLQVERREGVGELVVAEREHGLVDDDDGDLAAAHGLVVGVVDEDLEAGGAAGLELVGAWLQVQVEGPRARRYGEVDGAGGVGGAAWELRIGLAVGEARGAADEVDLDLDAWGEGGLDRDLERGRGGLHGEATRRDQALAAQAEHALGGGEGGDHEQLRGVTAGVVLLVGDQLDLLLLDVADGRLIAAGDPQGQLRLVAAALLVLDGGGDAVGAALLGGEAAALGGRGGALAAVLGVLRDLLPLVADLLPGQSFGAQQDLAAGDELAVDVGDDRVDVQRLALLHEQALALHADVEARGVDQQVDAGGPGLAVDVGDGGLGVDGGGLERVDLDEVDAQVVLAGGVGAAVVELRRLTGRVRAAPHEAPPRAPAAEGEVVVTWRAVAARRGGDGPVGLGVGERAAGEVLRGDGEVGVAADEVRALAGAGLDLVLGPAKLLDLDGVAALLALHRAGDHLELELGVAEVRGLRQGQRQVEAAEGVDRARAGQQLVALAVVQGVADRLRGLGRQVEAAAQAGAARAQPALDPRGLAGAVHLAVVEDVPEQLGGERRATPAALVVHAVPAADLLGQEGPVLALGREQHAVALGGQGEVGEAVGAGGRLDAAGEQLQLHAGERGAVGEAGGEGDEALVVGEGVEADAGRLGPADDLLLLPRLLRRPGRLDDDDRVAEAAGEGGAQVDQGLAEGVGVGRDGDDALEHGLAGRRGGAAQAVLVAHPQEAQISVPVGRGDGVDAHAQLLVAGAEHREPAVGGGVEDGEQAELGLQGGGCGTDVEFVLDHRAELLAVDVAQGRVDAHGVAGAGLGGAGDVQLVAGGDDLHAGDRGLDVDPRLREFAGVDLVGEGEAQRGAGRAHGLTPAAHGRDELERAEGVKLELLRRGGLARALGGGQAGGEHDGDLAIGWQRLIGLHDQPAAGLGGADQVAQVLVLERLGLRHQV
jgi:hypothetical protein